MIGNNGIGRDVRRTLNGETETRHRVEMTINRSYAPATRVWRRTNPTGRPATAAASVQPCSPPSSDHNYAAPPAAVRYSRQLQNEFALLKFAFGRTGAGGMENWPNAWRTARALVESAPPPARPVMVDGCTQTENPDGQPGDTGSPDSFTFAQNASLWEIAKSQGMTMLFFRAYVHGQASGSRTHTMPHDYWTVPETHRWKRLLPRVEQLYKSTSSTQTTSHYYYVTQSQDTPAQRPRISTRSIRPRAFLDL